MAIRTFAGRHGSVSVRVGIAQLTPAVQMLSRSAMRMPTVANQIVARRTFSSTRMQLASPYHYPEGPRSNLPFNPLTKFFAIRFWGFMATGFFLPFGVAVWQLNKNQ
ncbi:hypothetical protein D6C95_03968 [Aureobasidium pullulans]|nr:hypothetical protein D6C95_03968 [Aureobasidium pullulans]